MATIKCLVTYKSIKYVVSVGGTGTFEDLKGALEKLDVFRDGITDKDITVYDADFQTHVAVTRNTIVVHKDEIIVSDKEQKADGLVRVQDMLNDAILGSVPHRTKVPSSYVLPPVPKDIKDVLENHKKGDFLRIRDRIIQWLFCDLLLYDVYPGRLYEVAARELVARYPALADTTGNGYSSWKAALRFKAKYERRKLRGLSAATQDGAGQKRKDETNGQPDTPKHACREPKNSAGYAAAENEETLTEHIATMASEMGKRSPNMDVVDFSMQQTFQSRRQWLGTQPTVLEIISKYPALLDPSQMKRELQRMTDVTVDDALSAALTKVGMKVLDSAASKRSLRELLAEYNSLHGILGETAAKDLTDSVVLCSMPALLKGLYTDIIKKYDVENPECPTYPKVYFMGSTVLTSLDFLVCVQDLKVAERTLMSAMATLLATYWAIDYQFEPKVSGFLCLLSSLLGLRGTAATPLVSNVVKFLLTD